MKRFVVYFFGTDFDRVKIGRCKSNLYHRQNQIQNGCPDPIKLLGIIQCQDEDKMKTLETEIHKQFQEFQTSGEWFRLVPEISDYIEEFTESGKDILDEGRRLKREYHLQYHHKRYKNDPEYRQRFVEQSRRTRRELSEKEHEKERERKKKWYADNKERASKSQREYRQRPEVKERKRERDRERYRNNKVKK